MATILMIDDDVNIIRVVESRLKANGYTVISSTDPKTGIEKAKRDNPDLILLDITMPAMNGYEVIAALKQDEATKAIPVIMLSAKHEIDDIVRSMSDSCGAVDHISKPFVASEFLEKIARALRIFGTKGGPSKA